MIFLLTIKTSRLNLISSTIAIVVFQSTDMVCQRDIYRISCNFLSVPKIEKLLVWLNQKIWVNYDFVDIRSCAVFKVVTIYMENSILYAEVDRFGSGVLSRIRKAFNFSLSFIVRNIIIQCPRIIGLCAILIFVSRYCHTCTVPLPNYYRFVNRNELSICSIDVTKLISSINISIPRFLDC